MPSDRCAAQPHILPGGPPHRLSPASTANATGAARGRPHLGISIQYLSEPCIMAGQWHFMPCVLLLLPSPDHDKGCGRLVYWFWIWPSCLVASAWAAVSLTSTDVPSFSIACLDKGCGRLVFDFGCDVLLLHRLFWTGRAVANLLFFLEKWAELVLVPPPGPRVNQIWLSSPGLPTLGNRVAIASPAMPFCHFDWCKGRSIQAFIRWSLMWRAFLDSLTASVSGACRSSV
jgi:hypothetical protein